MTVLSVDQIAALWKSTGGSNCATAVAVALAESSGRTDAILVNTDSHHSRDRGLWQINDYWHSEVSDSCAFSASCNAKAAYTISSHGASWSQWATYTGGAYKQHLSASTAACNRTQLLILL